MNIGNVRTMIGAIVGDIIGRNFECSMWQGSHLACAECIGYDRKPWWNDRTGALAATFDLFDRQTGPTDDSLLTLVVAQWLLDGGDLKAMIKETVRKNPKAGWGAYLKKWAMRNDDEPCGSFGNGAAMRVSPVAYAAQSLTQLMSLANDSAIVTHTADHAISGARAMTRAVWLARQKTSKENIAQWISTAHGYDLSRPLDSIREGYQFSSQCPDTVPHAIRAFLEAQDFEETIRRAISIGGDADTIASMAGAIAGAYWGVPEHFYDFGMSMLTPEQREIVRRFDEKFCAN